MECVRGIGCFLLQNSLHFCNIFFIFECALNLTQHSEYFSEYLFHSEYFTEYLFHSEYFSFGELWHLLPFYRLVQLYDINKMEPLDLGDGAPHLIEVFRKELITHSVLTSLPLKLLSIA